uniref:Uncharacterized protein n=1 Tax=Meloidogyne enterolobii TaxID=390850 RepID=A0A6V7WIX0_MELEN|nr:unnamed protein product [Meloidogyne enterolobii]
MTKRTTKMEEREKIEEEKWRKTGRKKNKEEEKSWYKQIKRIKSVGVKLF